MLNRIFVNNCLGLDNFDMSFNSTHSVVNNNKNDVIKILRNIYNGSEEYEVIDESQESFIKLYFSLNNALIDYISSYLVLDSNYLVVTKSIKDNKSIYFINEKEVSFNIMKRVLSNLIDSYRIVLNLCEDPITILEKYILNHDENYSSNKYNYLKLKTLNKEFQNEIDKLNSKNMDEDINSLINIKNEIESFDLEKGEIAYINKKYNELNNEDNSNYNKVIESFNNALNVMKEGMESLQELEEDNSLKESVIALEDSFFNLKDNLDAFKQAKKDNKDENKDYIIKRYNEIKLLQEKYGNTYQEINDYYQSVIAKINYTKYAHLNLKNIEDKIEVLNMQMNNINKSIMNIRQNYILNIANYFNDLCNKFNLDIKLNPSFDGDEINFFINIEDNLVPLNKLKEYDNYNLITFLFNTIFLTNVDKTVIVDDDFSINFNKEEMYIFIKLINSFKNCIVLSDNEVLG